MIKGKQSVTPGGLRGAVFVVGPNVPSSVAANLNTPESQEDPPAPPPKMRAWLHFGQEKSAEISPRGKTC